MTGFCYLLFTASSWTLNKILNPKSLNKRSIGCSQSQIVCSEKLILYNLNVQQRFLLAFVRPSIYSHEWRFNVRSSFTTLVMRVERILSFYNKFPYYEWGQYHRDVNMFSSLRVSSVSCLRFYNRYYEQMLSTRKLCRVK